MHTDKNTFETILISLKFSQKVNFSNEVIFCISKKLQRFNLPKKGASIKAKLSKDEI